MKHFGMLKPVEQNVRVSVDWDALYRPPVQVHDPIEERIANPTQAVAHLSSE